MLSLISRVAPGAGLSSLLKWVGMSGRVIALDLLPMNPVTRAQIIVGDFTEETVLDELLQSLEAGA